MSQKEIRNMVLAAKEMQKLPTHKKPSSFGEIRDRGVERIVDAREKLREVVNKPKIVNALIEGLAKYPGIAGDKLFGGEKGQKVVTVVEEKIAPQLGYPAAVDELIKLGWKKLKQREPSSVKITRERERDKAALARDMKILNREDEKAKKELAEEEKQKRRRDEAEKRIAKNRKFTSYLQALGYTATVTRFQTIWPKETSMIIFDGEGCVKYDEKGKPHEFLSFREANKFLEEKLIEKAKEGGDSRGAGIRKLIMSATTPKDCEMLLQVLLPNCFVGPKGEKYTLKEFERYIQSKRIEAAIGYIPDWYSLIPNENGLRDMARKLRGETSETGILQATATATATAVPVETKQGGGGGLGEAKPEGELTVEEAQEAFEKADISWEDTVVAYNEALNLDGNENYVKARNDWSKAVEVRNNAFRESGLTKEAFNATEQSKRLNAENERLYWAWKDIEEALGENFNNTAQGKELYDSLYKVWEIREEAGRVLEQAKAKATAPPSDATFTPTAGREKTALRTATPEQLDQMINALPPGEKQKYDEAALEKLNQAIAYGKTEKEQAVILVKHQREFLEKDSMESRSNLQTPPS